MSVFLDWHTAKNTVLAKFENILDYLVVILVSMKHFTQSEFGGVKKRILINVVYGHLQIFLVFIGEENVFILAIIMLKQHHESIASGEAIAENTCGGRIGRVGLHLLECIANELKMVIERGDCRCVCRTSKRGKDTFL